MLSREKKLYLKKDNLSTNKIVRISDISDEINYMSHMKYFNHEYFICFTESSLLLNKIRLFGSIKANIHVDINMMWHGILSLENCMSDAKLTWIRFNLLNEVPCRAPLDAFGYFN